MKIQEKRKTNWRSQGGGGFNAQSSEALSWAEEEEGADGIHVASGGRGSWGKAAGRQSSLA